jgi:hypothetical protein
MHAELLEPAVEHDGHERELPFPALAGQADARVPAAAVGLYLPTAAVPRAEPHVAIGTACIMLHYIRRFD